MNSNEVLIEKKSSLLVKYTKSERTIFSFSSLKIIYRNRFTRTNPSLLYNGIFQAMFKVLFTIT